MASKMGIVSNVTVNSVVKDTCEWCLLYDITDPLAKVLRLTTLLREQALDIGYINAVQLETAVAEVLAY